MIAAAPFCEVEGKKTFIGLLRWESARKAKLFRVLLNQITGIITVVQIYYKSHNLDIAVNIGSLIVIIQTVLLHILSKLL